MQKYHKQKQIIKRTNKSEMQLQKYKTQIQNIQQQLKQISDNFQPMYAIIHFSSLKARYNFINHCKKYAMVSSIRYAFMRCLFAPQLPQQYKFQENQSLMIQSIVLPMPEEINWPNLDVKGFFRGARFVLSILFIVLTIFITSSCIALCTLYVTSSSNCQDYNSDTTLAQAQASTDTNTIFCFCSVNYFLIYSDSQINSFCSNLQDSILVSNIVQIAASVLSSVTNIILIVVINIIAQRFLKPHSIPGQHNFVFVSIFISNLINSTILPLILNADIFGFKSVSYLNFISFINLTKLPIFKDFTYDWFAVVSPYYTNFFIIGSISPLIQILVYKIKRSYIMWQVQKKCMNLDLTEPTIQKQANQYICKFPLDLSTQMAITCLQLFMSFMYASLIPLAMPIFTFGLFLTYYCKKYIIFNYTRRVPADQSLNETIINLIPFILFMHGVMGVWAKTTDGIFSSSAFLYSIDISTYSENYVVLRAFKDIILLGATAVILLWIIFDFTLVKIYHVLRQCFKDQLSIPEELQNIKDEDYSGRILRSNIQGSYKLKNNLFYRIPYKAYLQLKKRRTQIRE